MNRKVKYLSMLMTFCILIIVCNVKCFATEKNTKCKVIICGDSRVVGLANIDGVRLLNKGTEVNGYNEDKSIYYKAKVGQGYKWFNNQIEDIAELCDKDTIVYIALGMNDLYNVNKYKKLYNNLSEKLNNATIKICSIGSINEEKARKNGYIVKQKDMDSFNKVIKKKNNNYRYIDIWYGKEENSTVDGIHYTKKEYKMTLKKLISEG